VGAVTDTATARQLPDEWLSLDACAVSDALDRLGHHGVVPGIRPLSGDGRLVGRAVTVELGPAGDQTPGRHLGTAAIEAAMPGDVIVVAHRGRLDCAGWGGNLSLAAHLRGLAGVVVDGACRDLSEAASMGFAVYGRDPTPRTARGRVVELSFQRPIVLGEVTVEPGDVVVADSCGVVFVSRRHESAVMAAALEIVRHEAAMAAAIKRGTAISQVMGSNYETMTQR
jgi:regulator of RNase E activity RraA